MRVIQLQLLAIFITSAWVFLPKYLLLWLSSFLIYFSFHFRPGAWKCDFLFATRRDWPGLAFPRNMRSLTRPDATPFNTAWCQVGETLTRFGATPFHTAWFKHAYLVSSTDTSSWVKFSTFLFCVFQTRFPHSNTLQIGWSALLRDTSLAITNENLRLGSIKLTTILTDDTSSWYRRHIFMTASSCDLDRRIIMISSYCDFLHKRHIHDRIILSCDLDRRIIMISSYHHLVISTEHHHDIKVKIVYRTPSWAPATDAL